MGGHTEVTSGGESGHTWKAQLNKRSPAEHGLALRGPPSTLALCLGAPDGRARSSPSWTRGEVLACCQGS